MYSCSIMVSKTKSRVQPGSLPWIPGVEFLGCQSQKSTAMLHKAQRSLDCMSKYHYLPRKNRNLNLTHAFLKKGLCSSETKNLFLQGCNRSFLNSLILKLLDEKGKVRHLHELLSSLPKSDLMDAQEWVCSSGLHHIRSSGWINSWSNREGGEGSPCSDPCEGLGCDTSSSPAVPQPAPGLHRERQQPHRAESCCQHRTAQDTDRDGSTARASRALPHGRPCRRQRIHLALLHVSSGPGTTQGLCVTTQMTGDTVRTEETAMEAP